MIILGEMLPNDKYVIVETICNSLALLVSQCTMQQFVQRVAFLTHLQHYWTNGYEVNLNHPSDSDEEPLEPDEDVTATNPIIIKPEHVENSVIIWLYQN